MNTEVLIENWLDNSNLQSSSKKQYRAQVELYFNTYDDLNIPDLIDFLNDGQNDKRCYHRKYAITNLLKYMKRADIISKQQFEEYMQEIKEVKYRVRDRKEIDTILYDDLKYLIDNLNNEKLKLVLMLCFDTAGRIRSILKLRKKDIREYQGKNALFLREKGQKTDLKIITDQTYKHLADYIEDIDEEYIFLESGRATMEKLDQEYYELWKVLRRESKKILGEVVRFHSVRRGAGVYWYRKTDGDIVFVQKLYNHENPATTAKYLKLEGEKVRERMKQEERDW